MSVTLCEVTFFVDANGPSPVEDSIHRLTPQEQARIAREIGLLRAFGVNLREPHVRHVEGKLWELRARFNRRNFRVFYFISRNGAVLLHAIIKASEKTPRREIEVALDRMEAYLEHTRKATHGGK